jgi:hypothetical protein
MYDNLFIKVDTCSSVLKAKDGKKTSKNIIEFLVLYYYTNSPNTNFVMTLD